MANNRFIFTGLDELKAELRTLPKELTGEASAIVTDTAEGAASTVAAVYAAHRVTGKLAKSIKVAKAEAGAFGAGVTVKVTDPIAWLFDNGSQARHYITQAGRTHDTGSMWGKTPPTHIFARTMAKRRAAMYGALKDLLVAHGLTVTGKP